MPRIAKPRFTMTKSSSNAMSNFNSTQTSLWMNAVTHWRLLSFVTLMLALVLLMVKLAFWQMQRAEQKQVILSEYYQRSGDVFSLSLAIGRGSEQWRRVEVGSLHWKEQLVYLDNQFESGRSGYAIFQLANTPQGAALVKTGWVPFTGNRKQLPELKNSISQSQFLIRYPSKSIVLDADHWIEDMGVAQRVQQLNIEALSKLWGIELLPFYLDPNLDLNPEQLIAMPAEKHQAYALQWVLMAIVASILTIYVATIWWRGKGDEQ
ncbi:SURF1 family protein [Alginatibacterium sediminis]|uniref:SURF1-like protein n=2 Tax=Alginatibacterium sediminis TaxID=2164068 RepID=A0A420E5X0_9ALTE|nr:SURF1 family protein [Alginatibacterium sediminis]